MRKGHSIYSFIHQLNISLAPTKYWHLTGWWEISESKNRRNSTNPDKQTNNKKVSSLNSKMSLICNTFFLPAGVEDGN